MPKTLTVELVTPEKVALTQSADFVALPAFEGEMGILPGHGAFLVQLTAGEVRVRRGTETSSFAVSGGFAEILKNKVSVFAETAEMATEIDAERARQDLESAKAESRSAASGDSMTLAQAAAHLAQAQARVRVAQLRGRRGGKSSAPESNG